MADKLSAGHEPQQVSDADMTRAKAIISASLSGRSNRAGSISSDHMQGVAVGTKWFGCHLIEAQVLWAQAVVNPWRRVR